MTADLRAYLRDHHDARFRYGRMDCALFAAGWARLRTGRDLMLGIEYGTLREGRAKLAEIGHADHVDAAAAQLVEIPVAMAQRGDLAAVPSGRGGWALGIVTGERVAVLTRHKLEQVPLNVAARAFELRP